MQTNVKFQVPRSQNLPPPRTEHLDPATFDRTPRSVELGQIALDLPQIMPFTDDLNEHLVQMPTLPTRFHTFDTVFADVRGIHRAKPMPPKSHRFMADIGLEPFLEVDGKKTWKDFLCC